MFNKINEKIANDILFGYANDWLNNLFLDKRGFATPQQIFLRKMIEHEISRFAADGLKEYVFKTFNQEEFIDRIVDRINKKQIKVNRRG